MIKLPNLDDQDFTDIVEAAKRRIPVLYPEWTDLNEHDPGITILELFAWLKEMQQYYLNRISDRSYESMLKLLGIETQKAAPATARVLFSDTPASVIKGAEAQTEDGTVFICSEEFTRSPYDTGRSFVDTAEGVHDVTDIISDPSTNFYPFSSRHGTSDRDFYIGVNVAEGFSASDKVQLYFDINDRCAVQRNPASDNCRIPRKLVWEYSTAAGYKECSDVCDDTLALSFGGKVVLTVGSDFAENDGGGRLPSGRYIRVRMEYSGCEDMPTIGAIYTNCLELTQTERHCAHKDLTVSGGQISVSDKLICDGLYHVLVRFGNGWQYAERAVLKQGLDGAIIDLSGYEGMLAEDGNPNVRVIYCTEHFGRNKMFYSSDGLPCQQFELDLDNELMAEELEIMAAEMIDGEPVWQDYTYVDDLALAGPYDRCFTYDRSRRCISFGDNENGEVPQRGDENIMVITCSCTKGSAGNLRRGNLKELRTNRESFEIHQHSDAAGGRSAETLTHALERLKARMNECVKAVTAEDYRILAGRTPGLRIADVKAIPAFDPDISSASKDRLANTVTLVVLPYSSEPNPVPDESFIAAVREHIENYRMITTYVKVVAPIYVSVDISAEVISSIREIGQVTESAVNAVRNMYSIYSASGTRFGDPLSEVAVTTELCSVDGILSVKHLRINVDDSRCYRDKYGRIIIPPHAIACCGKIDIQVTEP